MKLGAIQGFLLIVFVLICIQTFSQADNAGKCNMTIKVKDVYAGVNGDGDQDEFGWRVLAHNSILDCIAINGEANWFYNINKTLVSNANIRGDEKFRLYMQGWEDDDCGDRCSYDHCGVADDDDLQCNVTNEIIVSDYEPGVPNFIELSCNISWYKAVFELTYAPPVPARPTVLKNGNEYLSGIICADEQITLVAKDYIKTTELPNGFIKPEFASKVNLVWEYQLNGETQDVIIPNPDYCGDDPACSGGGGPLQQAVKKNDPNNLPTSTAPCCDLPPTLTIQVPVWRQLSVTNLGDAHQGNFSFLINSLQGIQSVTSAGTVNFRAKATAGTLASLYSESRQIDIAPLTPKATSVSVTPSCTNSSTGIITVSGITAPVNNFRVIAYRTEDGPNAPGYFSNYSGTMPATVSVSNLPTGTYTVDLSYSSIACKTTYSNLILSAAPIVINTYTPRALTAIVVQQVSCEGFSDGIIRVNSNGGNSLATVAYTITPPVGSFNSSAKEFRNLPSGTYTIQADDGCVAPAKLVTPVVVTQPTRVTGAFSYINPTCLSTPNGMVSVSSIAGGSGVYDYRLLQAGLAIRTNLNSAVKNWTVNDLPGGSYQIDVTDAARPTCPGYQTAVLNLVPVTPLTMTYQVTAITCFGANDGRIQLQAFGGSGNYSYKLINSSTNEVINGGSSSDFKFLKKGIYAAEVSNTNSCPDLFSVSNIIVGEPDDISFAFTITPIICHGEENGKIAAIVSGGNGNYVFQWQFNEGNGWVNYTFAGGQSLVIAKLFPAQYRLHVLSDANNCSQISAPVTLVDPPVLELQNVAVTHVTCLNANDGTITPTASGGWGNYTYQYSADGGSTYFDLLSSTKLAGGSYRIRVKDEKGCIADYPSTIQFTQPATSLTASYSFSQYAGFQVSCSNGSDGQVTIVASGGNSAPFTTGAYLYSIDGGSFTNNNILSGLTSGSHQIQVKDQRGCIFNDHVTLTAPSPIELTLVNKNFVKCFGDNTGMLEVSAAGGLTPYQFRIDNGSFQASPQFTNLSGGNHIVRVRDKNLCSLDMLEYIDSPNPPLSFSIAKSDVLCFGQSNGSIQVNVQGGVGPYQYVWLNRSETSNQLTNLLPGSYTFQVTDQVNCLKQTTVAIVQPSATLSATVLVVPVQCHGDTNGKVTITGSGGTAPYQYSKNGGLTYQPSPEFINLLPGNYSFIIKDANACLYSVDAIIVEPPVLSIQVVSQTDVKCFAANTGSIKVNATGGVPPYQYSSDGIFYQPSATLSSLSAGFKTVYVKDQYGCVRSVSATLNQPSAPLALTYAVTNVKCKGEANGKIVVTVSGGTLPYNYKWSGRPDSSSGIFDLVAADYTITIRDGNDCEVSSTISVNEPTESLALQSIKNDVSCFGLSNGKVILKATGGYPPYEYSFQGGAYTSIDSYQMLSPQFYSLSVRDAMGCLAIGSTTILEPSQLTATVVNQINVSCFGAEDGFMELKAAGGTAPYQYSKDGGFSFQSSASFGQLAGGSYQLTLRDANGCLYSFTRYITQPLPLQVVASDVIQSNCGMATGSAKVSIQGGIPPYQYQWRNPLGQIVSNQSTASNLGAGLYQVQIIDFKNCSKSITVSISDQDGPIASISNLVDASCFDSQDGTVTVQATGGSGGYLYFWSDGQQTPRANDLKRGTYYATVTDSKGCKGIVAAEISSPDEIKYNMISSIAPLCYESCDGVLEIEAHNSIGPYVYQWQNGEITNDGKALQLCRGEHTVIVTADNGCSASFKFELAAPEALHVGVPTLKLPSCKSSCDGLITVNGIGGTPPYQYEWSGLSNWTTPSITNLCSGTYEVKVTDAHLCSVVHSIKLDEALPLSVDLGKDITLCYQQIINLDAGNDKAKYKWTKDATFFSNQRIVQIADAGLYEVIVESATGCIASDQIQIGKSTTAFKANFLGASQLIVGDTLLLTEVCFPKPDSVKWTLSDGLSTIGEKDGQPMVKAAKDGEYSVHLFAYYKECTDQSTKQITFFKEEDKGKIIGRVRLGNQGIKEVSTHPNPTSGLVQIQVQLFDVQTVALFLYSLDGLEIARSTKAGQQTYDFDIDLSHHPAGVYIAKMATNYQQKEVRIVLVK
ncbi:MAG: T9SS type A sorting domain-containing protein [Bacteroidetes bacterium]|nr:T9SS type A sorting domain-containing protein [Bacteroidota bacterium]